MFNSDKFPFTILSVHKLNFPNSKRYSSKKSYNALIFRHYGSAEISYGENRVILNKNDLTLIPKDFDYTICSEDEEITIIHFNIDNSAVYPFSYINAARPELFVGLFEKLLSVWKTKPLGYQYRVDALFLSILENIEIQSKTDITSRVHGHIYNIVDYMHKHFTDHDFSIENLAKQSGYCASYFRRIFKCAIGVSPQSYLTDLRLSYADNLLSSGYYSVKEVAFLCGFEDPKYFSTAYKSKRKKSPSKV